MSRSNPAKPKPRRCRKTVLLVGEGRTEQAFLNYLKSLFLERDAGINVKVEQAGGGSPDNVIDFARKRVQSAAYDQCLVLFDADIAVTRPTPARIGKTKMHYVRSMPCIEGLFLQILEHSGSSPGTATSIVCKKIFHDKYLNEKDKLDSARYGRIMPKGLLIERRKCHVELETVLKLLG